MTVTDTEAMTAVRALLDERQQYEGWIRGLDAHRDTASPQVYERVRADYVKRLDGVLAGLLEHAEQLRATVDNLASRQEELQQREVERHDTRQEAELRAAVGEFGDEEWNKLRDDADLEIALIAEERTGVEVELAELRRIMQLTIAEPEPAVAQQAPKIEAAPIEESSVAATWALGSLPPPPPQANARTPILAAKPGEDDTGKAIEDFVADWPVQHVGPDGGNAGGSAAKPAGNGAARTPQPQQQQRHTPAANQQGNQQTKSKPHSVPAQASPLFAAPSLGGVQEPSTEMRRDQEKTLKCPECGALNYGTEWYCERCGGELATY